MESKRKTSVSDNPARDMPSRVVGRAVSTEAALSTRLASRTPRRPKVIVVEYDEETFARYQQLLASFRPSASAPEQATVGTGTDTPR